MGQKQHLRCDVGKPNFRFEVAEGFSHQVADADCLWSAAYPPHLFVVGGVPLLVSDTPYRAVLCKEGWRSPKMVLYPPWCLVCTGTSVR